LDELEHLGRIDLLVRRLLLTIIIPILIIIFIPIFFPIPIILIILLLMFEEFLLGMFLLKDLHSMIIVGHIG
jgi:hypothetical protein